MHIDDHIENFDDFVHDLMIAGRKSRTRKPRYSRVQALLLSWHLEDEQDDDDVTKMNKMIEDEVLAVQGLFQDKLNFSVERVSFPIVDEKSKKPVYSHNKLLGKINDFVDDVDQYKDKDTLLVIYYNGHGSYRADSCYWHP